jgi:hypothetical protein
MYFGQFLIMLMIDFGKKQNGELKMIEKNNYKIIDNFLSENDVNNLYNFLISKTPWFFRDCLSNINDNEHFYFIHILLDAQTKIKSFFYDDILNNILNKSKIDNLIRIQANLFVKQSKHYKSEKHEDEPDLKNYKTAIFYVNTNNGYTILHTNKGDVKIKSIKNRLLIFDGKIQHRAVTQTDEKLRININIVFN